MLIIRVIMIIFKRSEDLSRHLAKLWAEHESLGFFPTMGALHQGHISLLHKSMDTCSTTITSIFINPTQFNNQQDLEKYPVTIEKDISLLERNGCDIVYLPDVTDVYPEGTSKIIHYDLGPLETIMEGAFRPGHFQGVCQVVDRLLEIVKPTDLFIGQKDYQQCMVISRLVEIMNIRLSIHICETLREKDGLAMSSRNLRLSEDERNTANSIYEALYQIKSSYRSVGIVAAKKEAVRFLVEKGFKIDYVEIADAINLNPVSEAAHKPLVALIAAWLHDIRLIDNFVLA